MERVRRDLLNTKLVNDIQSIRPEIVQLDLDELSQLTEKATQILSTSDHIDILINNAGVSMVSGIQVVKPEIDVRVMNVNYFGTIALTKGTKLYYTHTHNNRKMTKSLNPKHFYHQ